MRPLRHVLAASAAIVLASSIALGGPTDSLGKPGDPPDPKDRPAWDGRGKPARPGAWQPPQIPEAGADKTLHAKIDRLRKKIAEMKKVRLADLEPVDGLTEARLRAGRLREALEKARKDLTAVGADETKRLAEVRKTFDEKWKGHAGAVEARKTPEGMDAITWAIMCDDYYSEKADVEADLAGSAHRLKGQTDRKLAPLDQAVKGAEGFVERMTTAYEGLTGDERRFLGRMLAWKEHQAQLLAAREALAELERLQADRRGEKRKATDPIEIQTIEQTGYLLAGRLRMLVLREMSLADASKPPANIHDDLSLPDWMKRREAEARLKARIEFASEQLRLADGGLERLKDDLDAEDARELQALKDLGASEAEVLAKRRELAQSRAARSNRRRQELLKQQGYWKEQLEDAARALAKLKPPASAPATSPSE